VDEWLLGPEATRGEESRGGHRSCPLCKQDAIDPAARLEEGEIGV
jgi:hypothetical protein